MKRFTELDYQEQKKVIENNPKLKRDIAERGEERGIESAYFWIEEYLHDIPKGTDYRIENYGYDYIDFKSDFIGAAEYLNKVQHTFELLFDSTSEEGKKKQALIDKLAKYGDILNDDDYGQIHMKPRDYARVENICYDILYDFEHELLKRLQSEIDWFYDDDHCVDFILDYPEEYYPELEDLIVTDDLKTVFKLYEME